MPDPLNAAAFVLLIALGIHASRAASPLLRRRRARMLIAYATGMSLAAGFTGREAWPFSPWAMDNQILPARFTVLVATVVDSAGEEHAVDPRAFEPLPWVDLSTWLGANGGRSAAQFDSIAPWLMARLRGSLARIAAGGAVGTYGRPLGALAAPNTQLSPIRWDRSASGRPRSIAGIRIYEMTVDLDSLTPVAASSTRRLRFAYPRAIAP